MTQVSIGCGSSSRRHLGRPVGHDDPGPARRIDSSISRMAASRSSLPRGRSLDHGVPPDTWYAATGMVTVSATAAMTSR